MSQTTTKTLTVTPKGGEPFQVSVGTLVAVRKRNRSAWGLGELGHEPDRLRAAAVTSVEGGPKRGYFVRVEGEVGVFRQDGWSDFGGGSIEPHDAQTLATTNAAHERYAEMVQVLDRWRRFNAAAAVQDDATRARMVAFLAESTPK